MHKTVDNYSLLKLIYKDCFGVQSFQCQHKILKKKFVLKKMDYPQNIPQNASQSTQSKRSSYYFECFLNEINVSKQLRSTRTLKCQKILKAKLSLYVVYNDHASQTLKEMVETEFLTIQKKQRIAKQLIQLIKQLHQENCVIANLCPSNIYVDSSNNQKVLLFNLMLAQVVGQNTNKHIQSDYLDNSQTNFAYYAPEIGKYGAVSKASDIYSLGKCLKDLFSQKEMQTLFNSMTDKNFHQRPNIAQVQRQFKQLKNKNQTNSSNQSLSNSKINDSKQIIKGLTSCKSLNFQKFGFKSDKSIVQKKQSIMVESRQFLRTSGANLKVKSRFSQTTNDLKNSNTEKFLNINNQKLKDLLSQSKGQSKLLISRQSTRQKLRMSKNSQQTQCPMKANNKQIIKVRNIATFAQELCIFCQQNEQLQLSFLLFKKALILQKSCYQLAVWNIKSCETQTSELQTFQTILKQELAKFQLIYNAFIRKLKENSINIQIEIQAYKKYIFSQELLQHKIKQFVKKIIYSYQQQKSSDQSNKAKGAKSKPIITLKTKRPIKIFDNDQSLFYVLMLAKKIEFQTFQNFFKKKIHKQQGKYWNKNSFKVEKTFGREYFLYQIKSILNLNR